MEYEDEDDLGPGSGKRFILTPDRIVSLTISENPPPHTAITVNGLLGQGLLNPSDSFRTSSDGNAITSAYAVDYDMWYQYGFKIGKAIEAPYFSDPEIHCAPFAVSTLLEARENVLQGTVEVAGYNEYYQPGDVVYIEDRGLLFYVKSVSHSCSYGKLSTTLSLTYGHNPGEYIPTMLDVAGKLLYNTKGLLQDRSEKFEMLGSAKSIGALVIAWESSSSRMASNDPAENLKKGKYGARNTRVMNNMLFSLSGSLNHVNFRKQRSRIKIVYYKTPVSDDNTVYRYALAVRDQLINPDVQSPKDGSSKTALFKINEEDVIIEEVDFGDPTKQTRRRVYPISEATEPVKNDQGPSSAAWATIKTMNIPNVNPNQMRSILANMILDIFIDYEVVQDTASESAGTSQAEQLLNATVSKARGGRAQGVI
jgi:hypothetical protein